MGDSNLIQIVLGVLLSIRRALRLMVEELKDQNQLFPLISLVVFPERRTEAMTRYQSEELESCLQGQ
jgi:hypothetical protein